MGQIRPLTVERLRQRPLTSTWVNYRSSTGLAGANHHLQPGSHPRPSAWSWWFCWGGPAAPGPGVLLGVIKEAGELESGSSTVSSTLETVALSSESSVDEEEDDHRK